MQIAKDSLDSRMCDCTPSCASSCTYAAMVEQYLNLATGHLNDALLHCCTIACTQEGIALFSLCVNLTGLNLL
jgi:hypothetical protein